MRWEYKIIIMSRDSQAINVETALNNLGEDDWELVHVSDNFGFQSDSVILYLMKEKKGR